ncbi:hypothetical protein F5B20DRAFT_552511 [Whalleya microplaca]|nr:hypothetical protein F5B20DRAFT_552511 [Whalleya microplaca]
MTSLKILPSRLNNLSSHEAIIDAIYRTVVGLDTNDQALFQSSFIQDAVFDLNGTIMTGLDAIDAEVYTSISKLDTTHFITNFRVQQAEGAATASVTAHALAQHYRGGTGLKGDAPRLLAGSLYQVDVVRDEKEDLWKVKNWKMQTIWAEGDWTILTGGK